MSNNELPKGLFKDYDTVIFFDTETSGLSPTQGAKIVELGALVYRKSLNILRRNEFENKAEVSQLLKLPEGSKMDPVAAKINHISDEMLESQGADREEAFRQFANNIGGKTLIVAYNAHFDYLFLVDEYQNLAKSNPDFENALKRVQKADVFDPLTLARARVTGADKHNVQHRLVDMVEAYNVEGVENSHRALDDVKAMLGVVKEMHKEAPIGKEDINLLSFTDKYGKPELSDEMEQLGCKYISEESLKSERKPIRIIKDEDKFLYPVVIHNFDADLATELSSKAREFTKKRMIKFLGDELHSIDKYGGLTSSDHTLMIASMDYHDEKLDMDVAARKYEFVNEFSVPVTWNEVIEDMKKRQLSPVYEVPEPVEEPPLTEASSEQTKDY